MHTTHDIYGIAADQHGLLTVRQATRAGMSAGQIHWLTRSGRWVPLRPGVYALAGSPRSWMQLALATALSLQPRAWLSHATASELWGFPGIAGDGFEVLVAGGRTVEMEGVHAHRTSRLFTADLTTHRGVPITTAERTLVDLSARVGPVALAHVLDDALRRRVIRLERLRRCANRLAGAPGRRPAVVRALLAERLPGYDAGDSDIETRVLRVVVDHGLPVPVQQHRLTVGGRKVRIDLAYPGIRLAIELDGWEFHRTRTAFDSDRARANGLVAAGWTVMRFTSRSSDAEIVACLRAALRRFAGSGAA